MLSADHVVIYCIEGIGEGEKMLNEATASVRCPPNWLSREDMNMPYTVTDDFDAIEVFNSQRAVRDALANTASVQYSTKVRSWMSLGANDPLLIWNGSCLETWTKIVGAEHSA